MRLYQSDATVVMVIVNAVIIVLVRRIVLKNCFL